MALGTQIFVKGEVRRLKKGAKDKLAPNIDFLSDVIRRTKRSGRKQKEACGVPGLKPTALCLPNSRNIYKFYLSREKSL